MECKKDYGVILDNTCMPLLMKGLKTIIQSKILFSFALADNDDMDGKKETKLILDLNATNRHSSTVNFIPCRQFSINHSCYRKREL